MKRMISMTIMMIHSKMTMTINYTKITMSSDQSGYAQFALLPI